MKKESAGSNDTVTVVDITSVVESCASSLSVLDPFLCGPDFSLHSSMTALELMDRKLDCCEIPISAYDSCEDIDHAVPPRPPPTGLGDLPWETLTLTEARTISLELLTRLESLLSGASVSESTFTCLYTHAAVMKDMQSRILQPGLGERMGALLSSTATTNATPAQHVVYAASLGAVAMSHVVQNVAFNADIYEEEDFSIHSYGLLDYFGEMDEALALSALDSALDQIWDDHDGTIIKLVLGFLGDFLRSCLSLASLSAETVRDAATRTKLIVSRGVRKLEDLHRCLVSLDGPENRNTISRCFDLYVNRPLVGNTPIRKMVFRSPEETIVPLKAILSEVGWAVCDLLLEGKSLRRIRDMLECVSSASVNILSRSLVVLNLYFDNLLLGQHEVWSLIAQDLVKLSGTPLGVVDSKFGRGFLHRLAKPIYDTLKLLLLNRNRQRAFIESVMLQEWSALQQEANAVDVSQKQEHETMAGLPPLFTFYVLRTTASLMERHLGLGIELELFYGKRELSTAYWYRNFLLASLLNSIETFRQTKLDARRHQTDPPRKGKKKGSGRRKTQGKSKVDELQDLHDDFEVMLVTMKRDMCQGLVRLIAALDQIGPIRKQTYKFTCFEQVYQKQFIAFRDVLQPPQLTYGDYLQGTDFAKVTQSDLLSSAADCFKHSKNIVDKLLRQKRNVESDVFSAGEAELQRLAKVCVGNSVFIHILTQRIQTDGVDTGKVTLDLQTHHQFCMFKMS